MRARVLRSSAMSGETKAGFVSHKLSPAMRNAWCHVAYIADAQSLQHRLLVNGEVYSVGTALIATAAAAATASAADRVRRPCAGSEVGSFTAPMAVQLAGDMWLCGHANAAYLPQLSICEVRLWSEAKSNMSISQSMLTSLPATYDDG